MTDTDERRFILEMISSGKITAEEGLQLIQALPPDNPTPEETGAQVSHAVPEANSLADEDFIPVEPGPGAASGVDISTDLPAVQAGGVSDGRAASADSASAMADFDRLRRWWMIPLWAGVTLTVLSGLGMLMAQRAAGFGFWFYCSWAPFLLGLAVIVLAWGTRTSRWLHLRIRQKPGEWPEKIVLSFPLPLRLTAWFLRHFGHFFSGLQDTAVGETILLALSEAASPETPVVIQVADHEDGETVEIIIA